MSKGSSKALPFCGNHPINRNRIVPYINPACTNTAARAKRTLPKRTDSGAPTIEPTV